MTLADQIIEHGPYEPRHALVSWDTAALNELRDELIAARALTELLASGRYAVEPVVVRTGRATLWLTCNRCRWFDGIDATAALGELVRRAAEHAEVCGAPASATSSVVWICNRCNHTLSGNPRLCPYCGYTVYRPSAQEHAEVCR